jgi:predicted transcriptional regulator
MENEIVKELEEKINEINNLFRKIYDNGLELRVSVDEIHEVYLSESMKILRVKVSRPIYPNRIK